MSMTQPTRRQFLGGSAALLAAMGVSGLAGCSGGSDTGSAASGSYGIPLGDELTIISLITNGTFTPVNAAAGFDKVVLHALFDTLFVFDADGNLQPCLAESYEQNGFDVTIKLRTDVSFTDGAPLTADDVVFSFDVYENDTVNGPYIRQYITSIEKVDDATVLVHSLRDDELWKNILAEYIYIMEAATYDASSSYADSAPTGTGAYLLDSVDEARTVTLTANEATGRRAGVHDRARPGARRQLDGARGAPERRGEPRDADRALRRRDRARGPQPRGEHLRLVVAADARRLHGRPGVPPGHLPRHRPPEHHRHLQRRRG